MPSMSHEGLIALFRNQPALAPQLLRDALHIALPAYAEVRIEEADFTQLVPTAYRADLVVLLVDGQPVFGIIVEVQLSRDEDKRYSWPLYAAALRARLRCPCCVLVFAPEAAVAAWASQPIETGQPGSPFVPLVLDRHAVPMLTDAAQASDSPELAVLSSLSHGNEPGGIDVVIAMLASLPGISDERTRIYYDLVWTSLAEASRQALEAIMQSGTYQYQSEFARKYVAEGEAKGEAKALLTILAARSLAVSDEQRARILACQDLALLEQWLKKAVSAASVADVLD